MTDELDLQNLTLDEIDELQSALETIKKFKSTKDKIQPKKKKRGRPPKKKVETQPEIVETTEDKIKKQPPRRRVIKKVDRRISDEGTPCIIQPLNIKERKNTFFESEFANMHREDVQIDKKLISNNTKLPRRLPVEYVDVECSRCGRMYTTLENHIYKLNGELIAICPKCSTR